ncbi:hypothetical protein [Streptomyces sp. NPDC003952]
MSEYTKTIRDTFEDTAEVSGASGSVDVELSTRLLIMTPAQARALAKALKRAANVAEGKPAKASKPDSFVDGDGDTWHLSPNGFYSLDEPSTGAHRTMRDVRREYGIQDEG